MAMTCGIIGHEASVMDSFILWTSNNTILIDVRFWKVHMELQLFRYAIIKINKAEDDFYTVWFLLIID